MASQIKEYKGFEIETYRKENGLLFLIRKNGELQNPDPISAKSIEEAERIVDKAIETGTLKP